MEKKVKEIPSEIVFQILGWLPVKSLNRFKCVSTSWSSMIFQHRPYGHIVVNVTSDNTRCAPRSSSMKAGLFCGPIRAPASSREQIQDLNMETFVQQLSLPYLCYENITPVVNGLACLYTGHQVSLFNMFTCEIMNLPSSSLHPESSKIWYALGFDPIDNVYKLFKVCAIPKPNQRINYYEDDRGNKYDLVYEVLTLDTSSISEGKWREEIDKEYHCEFSNVSGQSYFVNGIIFWKFNGRIISFDVHQEKINIVEPPPMAPTRTFGQFEGHLALSYTHKDAPSYDSWILDIWMLEDHENSKWTKVTIKLPTHVEKYFYEATPIGNFPSGELVLSCFESQKVDNFFYTYDPIKRKFTRLMIDLPRSLALARRTEYPAHMACLFENMSNMNTPLDDLVAGSNK